MLSTNEVSHIARLARLRLEAEEMTSLGSDLSKVLDYMAVLNEVEVEDVVATESGGDTASGPAGREDVALPGLENQVFLRNAPKTLDRFLLVPAIK